MFPQGKAAVVLASTGVTNGQTVTGQIDTLGADFLTLDVYTSTSNNATNKPSTLKISEADDTNSTSFSDIAAFVGGGASGFTIPSWSTATTSPLITKFNIDLRSRKRYLKLTVTPVTTQDIIAIGNLFRMEQAPITAANANVLALVSG